MGITLHEIVDILNKFGFALVLGGLFIWNSIENSSKLDKLQADYLASQKIDREEYIKLNKEMIETLNNMNNSINTMNNRIEKLEIKFSDRN